MVRDCRDDDAGDREMADAAMVCTEETAGETPMCGCQSCTPCQLSGGGFGLWVDEPQISFSTNLWSKKDENCKNGPYALSFFLDIV